MEHQSPKTTYLKDYLPPRFSVTSIGLTFELAPTATKVTNRMVLVRQAGASSNSPLELHGESLELLSLEFNGAELNPMAYDVRPGLLVIKDVPDEFELVVKTLINPKENKTLSGLYQSNDLYCTQCESQGFRRMTYFLDRPDVMTSFRTTIIGPLQQCPVMLSNGNMVEEKDLGDGRHLVTWEDPFKKPCYLFALVAGDLSSIDDHFQTMSGRMVKLQIFAEHQAIEHCRHALDALKKAMKWDEETYGREYDLDHYMIVAVSDFNSGAMENKGLNLFNDKYIIADPNIATDRDYAMVENVIGHEYFHNWSGNRVTCRDWFQLSLKEGLTIFREQQFGAAISLPDVKRIDDVRVLRASQFHEDAGPMAHPVQPDAYIEINNFYTMTIYHKGSEVIRMIQTLIGPQKFRKGMDIYFERHDGQAVTIEEFVRAMEDAGDIDLNQFRRWYRQAGTPVLKVKHQHDPANKTFTLTVEQSCQPSPGQAAKEPYHMPLVVGLLSKTGRPLSVALKGESETKEEYTLSVKEPVSTFVFTGIEQPAVPSLLRGFSAPVKLEANYSDEELQLLFAFDRDSFARWEAGQEYILRVFKRLMSDQGELVMDQGLVEAYRYILNDKQFDPAMKAEMLMFPEENYLAEQATPIDIDHVHRVRGFMLKQLSTALHNEFRRLYDQCHAQKPYQFEQSQVGQRTLKNICLSWLLRSDEEGMMGLALNQFDHSDNMTDTMAALASINHRDEPARKQLLARFYETYQSEPLVIDKWLGLQARSERLGTLTTVEELMQHPAFDIQNPNRLYSLVRTFARANLSQFHLPSGKGYQWLSSVVEHVDQFNPQVASRLVEPLIHWQRFAKPYSDLMKAELDRLTSLNLSKNTYEIVSKGV